MFFIVVWLNAGDSYLIFNVTNSLSAKRTHPPGWQW